MHKGREKSNEEVAVKDRYSIWNEVKGESV